MCPDIKIDKTFFKKPEKENACIVIATHLNQLAGRMVFNSIELFVIYLCNAIDKQSEMFCHKFIN